MDDAITPTYSKFRNPGRPMSVGRLVYDKDIPGRHGIFVGRCTTCNDKVLLAEKDAAKLAETYIKDRNSLTRRLTRILWAKRHI